MLTCYLHTDTPQVSELWKQMLKFKVMSEVYGDHKRKVVLVFPRVRIFKKIKINKYTYVFIQNCANIYSRIQATVTKGTSYTDENHTYCLNPFQHLLLCMQFRSFIYTLSIKNQTVMSVWKFLTLSYKIQRTLSTALQVECYAMITKNDPHYQTGLKTQ